MPLRPLTPRELELKGFFQAKKIAHYLYVNYCHWTTEGKRWSDYAARDGYYMVCDLWKIQRVG